MALANNTWTLRSTCAASPDLSICTPGLRFARVANGGGERHANGRFRFSRKSAGSTCLVTSASQAVVSTPGDVAELRGEFESASPLVIMDKALELFGADVAIAFSGSEDVALIELASLTGRPFRVFSLDTGRLNPETYRFLHKVEQHYGLRIEVMFPDSAAVQRLVQAKGLFSFYQDGHQECCSIRKVEPLRRALGGLRAWITGQRRDQSADTRSSLEVVEVDRAFHGRDGGPLIKFNPLAGTPSAAVWSFLEAHKVPVNELHNHGYVSIGCEPCTRPVRPNQHEREGRWWWEAAAAKECGLHKAASQAQEQQEREEEGEASSSVDVDTDTTTTAAGDTSRSAAASALTPRELQSWPDLYVSPHVSTFTRDTVEALLAGREGNGAVSEDGAGGAAAIPAPQGASPASWLLVVYAPWCPFCQALEPALLETAETLAANTAGRVRVAKLQGDRDMKSFVGEKLLVRSFPTILVVQPRHAQGTGASTGASQGAQSGPEAQQSQGSAIQHPGALVIKRQSERRDSAALIQWVELLA